MKALFTLTIILTTSIAVVAQPDPIPEENPDAGVPLDGGVSLLIAGGVSYVAVKIRKQQLKRKAEEQHLEK